MVVFLNTLYKMVDEVVSRYIVFKVQSKNDSFMIISGIPMADGIMINHHAAEIAALALDLLRTSAKFSIPHKRQVPIILTCLIALLVN